MPSAGERSAFRVSSDEATQEPATGLDPDLLAPAQLSYPLPTTLTPQLRELITFPAPRHVTWRRIGLPLPSPSPSV